MDTKRVWFVEDDGNDVLLISRALRKSGLVICPRFARNAEQLKALFLVAQLTATLPDAIVTDLKLEGEDGFAIIQWVRSQSCLMHVPIIVLTSSPLEADRQASHRLGAQAFLTKCSGDPLAALLRNTLAPLLHPRVKAEAHVPRPSHGVMWGLA